MRGNLDRLVPLDLDKRFAFAPLSGFSRIASFAPGPQIAFANLRSKQAFGTVAPGQIIGHPFGRLLILRNGNNFTTAVILSNAGNAQWAAMSLSVRVIFGIPYRRKGRCGRTRTGLASSAVIL